VVELVELVELVEHPSIRRLHPRQPLKLMELVELTELMEHSYNPSTHAGSVVVSSGGTAMRDNPSARYVTLSEAGGCRGWNLSYIR
jgi:hypothetical protein